MTNYPEIDRFFNVYYEWISQLFPSIPNGTKEVIEGATEFIGNVYLFKKPGMSTDEIERLAESAFSLPAYYIEFLSEYSYRNLELPIFTFPDTIAGADSFLPMVKKGAPFSVLPFSYDKMENGVYCIDFSQNEKIVFFSYANDRPNHEIVASSFLTLLSFISEYLEWGGSLGELDISDREEAVTELKSRDPHGIGGDAWSRWWLPRLE